MTIKIRNLVILSIVSLFGLAMVASAAETETIRVGFFYQDGYHEIDENGNMDGYGYALARYSTPTLPSTI